MTRTHWVIVSVVLLFGAVALGAHLATAPDRRIKATVDEVIQQVEQTRIDDSIRRQATEDSILSTWPQVDVGSREYREARIAEEPGPCDRPRPYKGYSLGELTAAMNRDDGTNARQLLADWRVAVRAGKTRRQLR